MHRFCSECIITALRNGNKECPTCRKKLVSKRSLRHDPNFDALISKICPSKQDEQNGHHNNSYMNSPVDSPLPQGDNFDDTTEENASESANRRKRSSRSAAANSDSQNDASEGVTSSARKYAKRETTEYVTKPQRPTNTTNGSSGSSKTSIDIILKLKPSESEQKVEERVGTEEETSTEQSAAGNQSLLSMCKYLKTTRDAVIEHIAVYLKLRNEEIREVVPESSKHLIESGQINLFVKKRQSPSSDLKFIPLQNDLSLSHIVSEYNMPKNRPLELYFTVSEVTKLESSSQ